MTVHFIGQQRDSKSSVYLRVFVRRHLIGVLAIMAGTVICTYVLTDGRAEFTRADRGYYDALGDSMMRGRWDVPPSAIGREAFLLFGRTYGYFGPTPAVVRLPLNLLVPSMRGRWTRPVMITSCFLTLLGSYIVLLEARRLMRRQENMGIAQQAADAFFMMCAALASPLFFIMRSPVIYHEASLVSVACAIWTSVLLLRYRERGRLGLLIGTFFCALASFQARGSVGAGPMLSVALVSGALAVSILDRRYTWLQGTATRHLPSLPHRTLRRHAAAIALIAGICTSAVAYKNVVVFGSLAGTPPMSRNIQLINARRRLALTDGGNFVQPLNLRTTLANYLDPRQFRFEPVFPYFHLQHPTNLHVFPETKLDNTEAFASLTAINTIWSLLIVLGLYSLVHHRAFAWFQIPAIGAIGGLVPILIFAYITERYLLDVFPLMILAGAVAWSVLLRPVRPSWRSRTATVVMIALGLYSCFANIAATMTAVRWNN